mmetsp:Transcript_78315/g.153245  ORF Transcript_78315/g.153245 Transcript_78315/m.153245 type:complete len:83 (-) Transcript_78315:144-392(-)
MERSSKQRLVATSVEAMILQQSSELPPSHDSLVFKRVFVKGGNRQETSASEEMGKIAKDWSHWWWWRGRANSHCEGRHSQDW